LLARHPLVFYFVLAYAGTWLVELPYVRFGGMGLLPFRWPVPFLVAGILAPFAGPSLAAFVMEYATGGKAGVVRLLRAIGRWRVGFRWYLFAILGIPAINVLGGVFVPGVLASYRPPALAWIQGYPASFLRALVIGGPLGEEPGWRGFALPRLQRRYGPLVGTVILAPLHVLWHLPMFWVPQWGTPRDTALDVLWYALSGTAVTFVFTWLYNRTRGSVLLAVLAHTSMDAFFLPPFFAAPVAASNLPFTFGFGVFALLLVVATRGRLGYEPERDEAGHAPVPTGEAR
jgi:membrane protease YdiL (CAAX protease family)